MHTKKQFSRKYSRSKAGFTLNELLIVIAIISILASIILVGLNLARDKSRIARAQVELNQLGIAIELLRIDTGKWPYGCGSMTLTSGDMGEPLLDNAATGIFSRPIFTGLEFPTGILPPCIWTAAEVDNWNGPYMSSVVDPWGRPYSLDNDYYPFSQCVGHPNYGKCPNTDPALCPNIALAPTIKVTAVISAGPNGSTSSYDCDNVHSKVSE